MDKKLDELINLTKDNNRMLQEVIQYINFMNKRAASENDQDFLRNVVANLISSSITERRLGNY